MFRNPYVVHCITAEDFQEETYAIKRNSLSINVSESMKKNISVPAIIVFSAICAIPTGFPLWRT